MTDLSRSIINQADATGRQLAAHSDYMGPATRATVLAVPEDVYVRAGLLRDEYAQAGGVAVLLKGYHLQSGLEHFEAAALKLNAMPGVKAVVAAAHGRDKRFAHGDMLVLGRPVDATVALFTGENRIGFLNSGAVLHTILEHYERVGLPKPTLPNNVHHYGTWSNIAEERRVA